MRRTGNRKKRKGKEKGQRRNHNKELKGKYYIKLINEFLPYNLTDLKKYYEETSIYLSQYQTNNKCIEEEILLFFKQFGKNENNPNMFDDTMKKSIKGIKNALYAKGGCVLDGKIHREFPEDKTNNNKIGVSNE